ncbi:MAG: hypothetical protein U0359_32825 [Byssovorax sp.]
MGSRGKLSAGTALVVLALGAFLIESRHGTAPPGQGRTGPASSPGQAPGAQAADRPRAPDARAVSAPAVSAPAVSAPAVSAPAIELAPLGLSPAQVAEANARSVVEASRSGTHMERLNPLAAPAPFDRGAFAENPRAYYETIEPGRVFMPAEAGPGVTVLDAVGATHLTTESEGSVRLRVQGVPLSPVTFTSFDMGAFDNDLASITVQADAAGVATARFRATRGTIDDVNILSASPFSAGQVAFLVTVKRD